LKKAGQMQKTLFIISILGSIGLLTTNSSCTNGTTNKNEFKFEYYPLTNVYHDLATNNYIYSLDGGKTWTTYIPTSLNEPGTMGKKVLITSETPEVWKQNVEHRQINTGSLINITDTTGATLLASNALLGVTERKVIKAHPARQLKNKDEEEKPKKTVKEFFKDIFKKKKK
jgi:hypothetical protein